MKEIRIMEVQTKGHCIEPYLYHLRIDLDYNKDEAKELKKRLEDNERLRKTVERWAKDKGWSHAEICNDLLKEIKAIVR